MSKPTLCIVVVNWNSGPLLSACVSSLKAADFSGFSIPTLVVVDNNSEDRSADFLTGYQCDVFRSMVLSMSDNVGFGRACNLGFQRYLEGNDIPDFVLFFNPDCEAHEDTFRLILEQPALHDKKTGIFGIGLVNDTGVSTSCSNFPTVRSFFFRTLGLGKLVSSFGGLEHHLHSFDHRSDRQVDQVMGAFFLVRGEIFDKLSGFDEQFFVYFEEVDFSLRSKIAGYSSMFLAKPKVYHHGCGTTESVKSFRLYLSLSSRLRYFKKHASLPQFIAIAVLTYLIEPIIRIGLSILRRSSSVGEVVDAYKLILRQGLK